MVELNALSWQTVTKWCHEHLNPGLYVRARLPAKLQVSWQISAHPPLLLPNLLHFFEQLLCAMHCSGFRGYSRDQCRPLGVHHLALSPLCFPVLSASSYQCSYRVTFPLCVDVSASHWAVRSLREKHICYSSLSLQCRAWPEVGCMPV